MNDTRKIDTDTRSAQADGAAERWLAMDTSTASMAIALLEGDKLVAESRSLSERNHSIRLVPEMQELLAEAGWTPRDIGRIGVGWGPGSYTGVRIGVTVAKTIAWTIGCPLAPVSSLEALAYGAWRGLAGGAAAGGRHWIVPLMDARRGQAYTALYEAQAGQWRTREADGVRDLARWAGQLDQASREAAEEGGGKLHLWFAGDAAPFREALAGMASDERRGVEARDWSIGGYDVGLLARTKPLITDPAAIHAFVPNYTQLAEAEKKWLAKAKT